MSEVLPNPCQPMVRSTPAHVPDVMTGRNPQLATRARKVRLAHLTARLPVGGMELRVANLARGLPPHLYECAVWCLEDADLVGQELRAEGHAVVELGKRRRRDFAMFARIAALVRRQRLDILHCHDELSWFYGTIGAALGGGPHVVMTMGGRRLRITKRQLLEQRLLARLTETIVCVSSYLRQQIMSELGVSPKKIVVIHNGIPLPSNSSTPEARREARAVLGLPDDALVVGSVGELSPVKNFDLALEGAAQARAVAPSLRLVIIGDGPCREQLRQKAVSLRLGDAVTFAGLRRDVPQLLPALDLYVCTSNYEGLSHSVLEAMAAAHAVVATAVGGNPEIIRHNETGILVERGNAAALARAIVELASAAEKRHALGEEARRLVHANYRVDRMVRDHDRVYQTVLHHDHL